MTIEERLCFIRAGYSAQDIANFEASENDPTPAPQPSDATPAPQPSDPTPAPQPSNDDNTPAWARALNDNLAELRKAIQAGNARFDDMGDDSDVIDAGDAALQQYLTGKSPAKTTGGKRK